MNNSDNTKKSNNSKRRSFLVTALLLTALAAAVIIGWQTADQVDSISFEYPEYALFEGQSMDVSAKTQPLGLKLSYRSTNENVAEISEDGKLTAVSDGEAEIIAYNEKSGKSASARIIVKEITAELSLPADEITLYCGEKASLDAVCTFNSPVEDFVLEYKSSDPEVAEVDGNGTVLALSSGESVIYISNTQYNVYKEVKVTVKPVFEGISFAQSEITLYAGESFIPQVIVEPEEFPDKDYELSVTSGSGFAILHDGIVTVTHSGDAEITATHTSSGRTAAMTVHIMQKVTKLTVSPSSLSLKVGETATVNCTVYPTNASNKSITWQSSSSSVEINASGNSAVITAVSSGTVTVKAVSDDDPNIFTQITVTVVKEEPQKPSAEPQPTYIDGILVVNKTYGLPKNYNQGKGLTPQTKAAFEEMRKAAAADGITLRISSGYRSYSYQNTLYQTYLKRPGQSKEYVETYSARPGYSEHQAGVAIDVNMASQAFLGTPEQKWLEKHCVEYGFIIRYPEGKQQYTGFMYEPWHIRYLGKETAAKVDASGLCLEEYLGITSEYND